MVTFKTLEVYLDKAQKALMQTDEEYKMILERRDYLRDTLIAIKAQIELTQQMMDIENNPQHLDIPMAGEAIEELFDNRLEGPEGLSPEEVHKERQVGVYLNEALQAIEDIDAINTKGIGAGEDTEGDT